MNAEHGFAAKFSSLSTIKPLTDMSYENFAFFQFLGSRIGPIALIAMLTDNMPIHPGRDTQVAALAAVPEMEATFEEFVRSVLDNTLIDSDGGPINIPVNYTNEFLFTEISSIGFSGSPFVVARYKVSFAGEKEFSVSSVPDGEGRSAARLRGTTGGWASIPESVRACGQLDHVLYVITTTPAAVRTETIATTMVTEAPCDECLIGRWEATNDSMLSYMQSVVSTGEDNVPTVESVTGIAFLDFDANGTGTGGYENFKVHETGVGGNRGHRSVRHLPGLLQRTIYSGWLRAHRSEWGDNRDVGHRAGFGKWRFRRLNHRSLRTGGLPGQFIRFHRLHLRW